MSSSTECRAKHPDTCRYHKSVSAMQKAAESFDFDAFDVASKEFNAAEIDRKKNFFWNSLNGRAEKKVTPPEDMRKFSGKIEVSYEDKFGKKVKNRTVTVYSQSRSGVLDNLVSAAYELKFSLLGEGVDLKQSDSWNSFSHPGLLSLNDEEQTGGGTSGPLEGLVYTADSYRSSEVRQYNRELFVHLLINKKMTYAEYANIKDDELGRISSQATDEDLLSSTFSAEQNMIPGETEKELIKRRKQQIWRTESVRAARAAYAKKEKRKQK